MSGGNNVRVVCRIRPQNSREIESGGLVITTIDESQTVVHLKVIFRSIWRQHTLLDYASIIVCFVFTANIDYNHVKNDKNIHCRKRFS